MRLQLVAHPVSLPQQELGVGVHGVQVSPLDAALPDESANCLVRPVTIVLVLVPTHEVYYVLGEVFGEFHPPHEVVGQLRGYYFVVVETYVIRSVSSGSDLPCRGLAKVMA